MSKREVYWFSEIPTECQVMKTPITNTFVDGKIAGSGWALMHPKTHERFGVGLGMGRGQKYAKQTDGRWLKVEG